MTFLLTLSTFFMMVMIVDLQITESLWFSEKSGLRQNSRTLQVSEDVRQIRKDISIPTQCFDHDPRCSERMKSNDVHEENFVNVLAEIVNDFNENKIDYETFLNEICTTGNELRRILKSMNCEDDSNSYISQKNVHLNYPGFEYSADSVDRAVVFARNVLARTPSIRDSRVLDENAFMMSFVSTMQKLFHGIVPFVANSYDVANMFRDAMNRITRPGFVLFRKDKRAARSGRVMYPMEIENSTHKILIFSTISDMETNKPDMSEYMGAVNALRSGRSDLVVSYLSIDDH